jgi:glutamine amidotransferase
LALVDYGSGNLRSVAKALEACGATVKLARTAEAFDEAAAVVVPGVGSFGDCASNLAASGLREPILEWLKADRPYLGICLGYQLLFPSSEESPGAQGLGYLEGRVERFQGSHLKVPHMGWNTVDETRGPLFSNAGPEPSYYFVHSYYPVPADAQVVSARCDYGGGFAASVSVGRVHATQFHPEKSQAAGLELLRGFLRALNSP